jgi:hypothetical protein
MSGAACKLRAVSSPLSQDLAAKIIEVLTQRGYVLLSKGGRPALVRELSDRMNDTLTVIVGRMPPPGIVDNEVTSTFGDEAVDDTVEEMVEDVAASLMDSDQVEDVFAEDAVIRRDVFRVVKDTLLSAERAWGDTEEADVVVALDTLGYVAGKAAELATRSLVEGALGRAAKGARAKLLHYTPEARSATFRAALATPDARLELEEAVADELSSLVDDGKVALPSIERSVPMGRSVASDERHAARARVDIASTRTLLRSGCTATWEYVGDDTISVSLVPMSEQDGRTVDAHVEVFAREVLGIFGRRPMESPAQQLEARLRAARLADPSRSARPPEKPAPVSSKPASVKAPAAKAPAEKAPVSRPAPLSRPAPASKPAPVAEKAKPAAKKPAPAKKAKPAAKKPAPAKKAKPAAKKPAPAKKAKPAAKKPGPTKKLAAKKAPARAATRSVAKKAAPAKKAKPVAKKAGAKKPARR